MADLEIDDYSKEYLLRRLGAEGENFLAVELPLVSKAVVAGLETGYFDRSKLTSFSFKAATLHFLESLLVKIFDFRTGLLVQNPCGVAVGIIRQVCEYSYKLALGYSDEQEKKAIKNFLDNEADLAAVGCKPEVLEFANELRKDFERYWPLIAKPTFEQILKEFRPRPTNGTFIGCDELYYLYRQSTDRLGKYPSDMEAYKGFYKPYEGCKDVRLKKAEDLYHFSELLLVPKDSRGPRTICREDLLRVETQMSYFDFMTDKLCSQTRGSINFKNQLVNRKIAEESSVTREFCTLDLKDASDRISLVVAKTVFRNSGIYHFFTKSRRASHVKVAGIVYPLHKVAGMGSGLTFPTMSLLISLAICNVVAKSEPSSSYEFIRENVFVYGDDICVPTRWYGHAKYALTLIGLKVNSDKSFAAGFFRESCGGDYYAGVDVTPIRLKLTNSKATVSAIRSLNLKDSANAFKELYEHSKNLYKKGYKCTAGYLIKVLNQAHEAKFGFKMPPGRFSESCNLFVNFLKGTDHVVLGEQLNAITVSPERIRNADERKFIGKNGRVTKRSEYVYLRDKLSAGSREVAAGNFVRSAQYPKATETIAATTNVLNGTSPGTSSSFSEITIPRKLTFTKVSVLADFIVDNLPRDRAYYQNQMDRENFINELAGLITCWAFHNALL